MTRRETTKFLSDLLESKFAKERSYWSREVTLDWALSNVKRVDYMQFVPEGSICISDIEKGLFVSYEVKSCKEDYNSGHGLNFETEKNYLVMPMSLYNSIKSSLPPSVGVMCPIPINKSRVVESDTPTPLDKEGVKWSLQVMHKCFQIKRQRPMTELLFCMLRSKK